MSKPYLGFRGFFRNTRSKPVERQETTSDPIVVLRDREEAAARSMRRQRRALLWHRYTHEGVTLRLFAQRGEAARLRVAFEVKLADLWVGAFWKRDRGGVHIWVCLFPCLPVHIHILPRKGAQ